MSLAVLLNAESFATVTIIIDMTPAIFKKHTSHRQTYIAQDPIADPKSVSEQHIETQMKHGRNESSKENMPAQEVCRYTTIHYAPPK